MYSVACASLSRDRTFELRISLGYVCHDLLSSVLSYGCRDKHNTPIISGRWLESSLLYRLRGLSQLRPQHPMGDMLGGPLPNVFYILLNPFPKLLQSTFSDKTVVRSINR